MTTKPIVLVLSTAIAVTAVASLAVVDARQGDAIPMDPDDISGVVTGAKGPEAGVWVIAETTSLPTKFKSSTRSSSPTIAAVS
jgi:hypothetical protein